MVVADMAKYYFRSIESLLFAMGCFCMLFGCKSAETRYDKE